MICSNFRDCFLAVRCCSGKLTAFKGFDRGQRVPTLAGPRQIRKAAAMETAALSLRKDTVVVHKKLMPSRKHSRNACQLLCGMRCAFLPIHIVTVALSSNTSVDCLLPESDQSKQTSPMADEQEFLALVIANARISTWTQHILDSRHPARCVVSWRLASSLPDNTFIEDPALQTSCIHHRAAAQCESMQLPSVAT
jgi:hypothetical protein